MKNVFIDSNIWLSLYSFSTDDLNQFMKLKGLIGKDIKIWLPEQVRNEVKRNRENKIKDAMTRFESWKFEIPNIVKGYTDDYDKLTQNLNTVRELHKNIINKIREDVGKKALHADKAISEIFALCTIIPFSSEIINSAYFRYNVGDPPGKDNKYGDAINWLSLLKDIPQNEDLYFIGADGDFQSVLNKDRFMQFLLDEWKECKNSDLLFFKSLTEFSNTHAKVIQLKHELQADKDKNIWITRLEMSESYSETHNIIGHLSKFSSWTDEQLNRIFNAVDENSQVGAICNDDDIKGFLESIRQEHTIKE